MWEYTDWSAEQTLEEVVSPEVANYTYDKETVPSLEVTNESTDSTVYVIYKTSSTKLQHLLHQLISKVSHKQVLQHINMLMELSETNNR